MTHSFTPSPVKPVVPADGLRAFDIRVGTIAAVSDVPDSDRLVRLTVDFGDHRRQIVAGIKQERADPHLSWGALAARPPDPALAARE